MQTNLSHKFIENMDRAELLDARERTITEIAEFEKKPFYVQHEFSNALDARLGLIDRLIEEKTEG